MSSQPSLLVFTLDPAVESARRRLLPRRLDHLGTRLLRRTLAELLAAGRATGCRLEVSSPNRLDLPADTRHVAQRGATFGERFRRAINDAQKRDGGPLVVVGSDVPGLGRRHLDQALRTLERNPDSVVLGPSPDGGFYLLATNQPIDNELAEVRWCCRDTLESLKRALRAGGREVVLLAPLRDLDRAQDLSAWIASDAIGLFGWARFGHFLRRLLAALCRPDSPPRLGQLSFGQVPVYAVRGPPRR